MTPKQPAQDRQNPVHEGPESRPRAPELGCSGDPVNPAAMTPAELAGALGLPEATVRRHLDEGAPQHANGSLNLVHYAAWLNRDPDAQ